MYGNTARMAEAVARGAAQAGMRKVIVHNLAVSPMSEVLADIFRYSALAIGAPTYNGGIFPAVDDLLKRLASRQVSNHRLGIFGGHTWASAAPRLMEQYNEQLKMKLVEAPISWKQSPNADALSVAKALGAALAQA